MVRSLHEMMRGTLGSVMSGLKGALRPMTLMHVKGNNAACVLLEGSFVHADHCGLDTSR